MTVFLTIKEILDCLPLAGQDFGCQVTILSYIILPICVCLIGPKTDWTKVSKMLL